MPLIGIRVPANPLDQETNQFSKNLEMVAQTGFEAIEINPEDFDAIKTGELDKSAVMGLKSLLTCYPFEVSVHVPLPLNLFNRDNPDIHRKVLFSALEFAKQIESYLLVYHPGRYVDNIEFARYGKADLADDEKKRLKELEVQTLRQAADVYPEITIAMENQRPYIDHSPYCYAELPWELAEQVRAVGKPNVGMMVDTGHLYLAAKHYGFDPIQSIQDTGLCPVHIHINDNHGIPTYYTEKDKKGQLPFGRGDEHIVPGTGTFPFQSFLSGIERYTGCFMIEVTNRYFYPAKVREAYQNVQRMMSGYKASWNGAYFCGDIL